MTTNSSASTQNIPNDLTKPTAKYRKHAWYAVFGLLLFVVVYFSLAFWFSWSAYKMFVLASYASKPLVIYLAAGCSAFLGIFMFKALFFIQHDDKINDIEVKEQDQPELFKFLHKLADDTSAPRPHRVFLSNRVNACVFYDLSILNFFFSSKKNLEIGLPLVNALSLGELKAVLAHEFGHFAQKSMSVGRWVYVAQQIAAHIIAKRDFLDSFLNGLSRFDIRVAWIGWIMRLIVWSIRSLMDSLFSLVVIAQRALTREMEFQADLVAVSVTGSDALIHALYKLQAADETWERTMGFLNSEIGSKRSIKNLFEVQKNIAEKIRFILDDPDYGKVKDIPAEAPEKHRLFKDQIAQPPKMWATHPENNEREENAKRIYIPLSIDPSSAWSIFANAETLQINATENLLKDVEAEISNPEETITNLEKFYGASFLNPQYKGAYLGRDLTRHVNNWQELYDLNSNTDHENLLKQIYPPQLKQLLKLKRKSDDELNQLLALKAGHLKISGGVIRHHGKEYKKSDLNDLIETQRKHVNQLAEKIYTHDKSCRSAHLLIAKKMGDEWMQYLFGLLRMLHYAEHTFAEVSDVRGLLNNVVAVALADGTVSSRELKKVIKTGEEAHQVLSGVYGKAHLLQLNEHILKKLNIASWAEQLGDFTIPLPDKYNINDWMNAIDSWFDKTLGELYYLRQLALEHLLDTETFLRINYKAGKTPELKHKNNIVPEQYTKLVYGEERELQTKLGLWDRFHTADGLLGSFLRTTVSLGIVGTVLWYSFLFI
ncbi:MAG: M48 family metalloprotease [Gammaproteobacteria bacterium]|nr:M48 family metalloprotease [Gammaproteobacteria bacterium]